MNIRTSLVLILAVTLTGCATEDFGGNRQPSSRTDEFTGLRTDTIHTSPIGGLTSEIKAPARITLSLSRHITKSGITNFTLTVNYNGLSTHGGGFGWLFIESGATLTLLIDGQTLSLESKDGSRRYREVVGATVRETAIYELPVDLAKRIGKAGEVKMRLTGSSYTMDKPFTESNRRTFSEFAAKFCP